MNNVKNQKVHIDKNSIELLYLCIMENSNNIDSALEYIKNNPLESETMLTYIQVCTQQIIEKMNKVYNPKIRDFKVELKTLYTQYEKNKDKTIGIEFYKAYLEKKKEFEAYKATI